MNNFVMLKEKRVLAIVAHPDDEVLGCGATLALLAAKDWRTGCIMLTKGIAGRYANTAAQELPQAQLRLAEQRNNALALLNVSFIKCCDFPDNRLDLVSRMDVTHAIKKAVAEFQPSLVLTHHAGDYNWDHQLVFDAVMMATRANYGDDFPEMIATFEVLSSTERAWQAPHNMFCPNIYVNIAETMAIKQRALLCYEDECRPYPHPRSVEAIEYLARKRGQEVGLTVAEAFHMIRQVIT